MRSFLTARVSDLHPGGFLFVECACGLICLMTKALLTAAGLPRKFLIARLPPLLHCPARGEEGRATVLIK